MPLVALNLAPVAVLLMTLLFGWKYGDAYRTKGLSIVFIVAAIIVGTIVGLILGIIVGLVFSPFLTFTTGTEVALTGAQFFGYLIGLAVLGFVTGFTAYLTYEKLAASL